MRESGKRFLKKSHRTDGRVSILRLAVRTLGRGLPRTLITVCVMLLSVLMLCSVWTQYVSIKEEIYMEAMSPWDYSITDGSAYLSVQQYNQDNLAITDETVMEIARRPEVTSVSALKSHEVTLKASPELSKRLSDYYNEAEPGSDISRREEMAGYPDWQDGLSRLEKTGEYIGIIVSLERDYLEHFLEENVFTSGAYDEDAFESGDYVLLPGPMPGESHPRLPGRVLPWKAGNLRFWVLQLLPVPCLAAETAMKRPSAYIILCRLKFLMLCSPDRESVRWQLILIIAARIPLSPIWMNMLRECIGALRSQDAVNIRRISSAPG